MLHATLFASLAMFFPVFCCFGEEDVSSPLEGSVEGDSPAFVELSGVTRVEVDDFFSFSHNAEHLGRSHHPRVGREMLQIAGNEKGIIFR